MRQFAIFSFSLAAGRLIELKSRRQRNLKIIFIPRTKDTIFSVASVEVVADEFTALTDSVRRVVLGAKLNSGAFKK